MRYVRLFREFFRACLVEEFEYRANFAANLLVTVFWTAVAVFTVLLYFYRTETVGGWTVDEVLALLGIFNAINGLIEFFLHPNMSRLVQHIRKGTLDFILLKPVDSQFYVSFRHLVFWRLVDVLLGLGLTAFALWKMGVVPSWGDVAAFVLLFAASVVTVYSLWMAMMTFSFWAVKVDNLSFLFTSIFETARFPVTVYRGIFRFILTYVLPIAFVTTVPAEAVLGRVNAAGAAGAAAAASLFFLGSRFFWKRALRSYTSASS